MRTVSPVRLSRREKGVTVTESVWDIARVCGVGGFVEALDVVDQQGWDCAAASALLRYARISVVEPLVNQRRLFGEARERAIAAGWLAAWEALRSPAIRTATSPWGWVRLAVTRSIKGDFIAERYKLSTRQAWRRYAAGLQPTDAAIPVVTISLDQELARGRDIPQVRQPAALGERLELIRDALVGVGWSKELAEVALVWCAANYSGSRRSSRERSQALRHARTPSGDVVPASAVLGKADLYPDLGCPSCGIGVVAGSQGNDSAPFFRLRAGHRHAENCEHAPSGRVRGFRLAAIRMHVAEWQLRRLALLVGGGARHRGLLELMVMSGPGVLSQADVQRCLRATVSRWATCPSATLAERYGTPRPLQTAA